MTNPATQRHFLHMGRPSTYDPDLAEKILCRLAAGETLRNICKDDGFPPSTTVRQWVRDDAGPGFAAQYACARDLGLDEMGDELLEVANTPQDGVTITTQEWGEQIKQGDMLGHRELRINTLKWYLAKLAPKRYGDKLTLDGQVDVGFGDRLSAARKATDGGG